MRGGATISARSAREGENAPAYSEHLQGVAGATVVAGLGPVTTVAAAGASANTISVPAGVDGQRKLVAMTAKASTGNVVVSPYGWAAAPIELRRVGEAVELQWLRGAWRSLTPLFPGVCAVAVVDLTGQAEAGCAVTIGPRTYTEGAGQQWLRGADAAAGATALAAAINADTSSLFSAVVSAEGNSVIVTAKTAGTAGNVTLSETSASVVTVESAHDGANARVTWPTIRRAVTAQDIKANEVAIPLPFTPTAFSVSYLSSAGVPKATDADATIAGSGPARITVTNAGTTDLVAGDFVCVLCSY